MLPSLAALALSAFLAATFLPGTTEALLLALVVAAHIEPWLLVAVASIFNVLGSGVNYLIGRHLERFSGSRWFPVSSKQLARGRGWFGRYGTWSLLLSWVPFIGDAIPVVAGLMRTPLVIAFPLVAIGKTARFAAIVLLAEGAFG